MRHPNKHIQAAIEYALAQGWTFEKSRGHAFGHIKCGYHQRGGCFWSIWSTPANPEKHARKTIAFVNRCRHEWESSAAAPESEEQP